MTHFYTTGKTMKADIDGRGSTFGTLYVGDDKNCSTARTRVLVGHALLRHCWFSPRHTYTKDETNIRFVLEMSNILTFCRYSIQYSKLYKRISIEYFPSCPPPQNRSMTIFYFVTSLRKNYNHQTTPHISYMYMYTHTRLQNKITNIT